MAIRKLPSSGDAPRSTGVPESLVAGGAADSAGFPWAGRTFDHHGTEFADDDGSTPEELRAAVQGVRDAAAAVRGSDPGADPSAALAALAQGHADAVAALSRCRLLIPLVAEAGDLGRTPEGRTVEKTQELSIVTVAAPDGRRVMPVFSSTDAMRRWNPGARPIPVPGPQAALAAAQEGTDLVIVDPGSPECEYGVRRPALRAVATGERSLPSWADADVRAAFSASVADDPRVRDAVLVPGDPEGRLLAPETDAVLLIEPGLGRDELAEVVERAQRRWAGDAVVAERVDSLRVVIRPAA
ncbi:SseB family protein [Leucobacter sp. CSA1]|uniref:SseB family protein n=1 Tax=Leucobacter chromiisoli TaxID=2796471 RepID=A0A934UVC0_9MICO|nr:SseB family protein [Leucobacter chromiisoli]MBK0419301.1 SseB family protein [Leucobacter chromiisoli]